MLTKYRLLLVTALIGVVATLRLAYPEWILPSDADIAAWVDAALTAAAPLVWLWTFYKTDTAANSLEG